MGIQVREKSVGEIEGKLSKMNTDLNKINYLESALKERGFSYEMKRFILGKLADLYVGRKMFDRAAKTMFNKTAVEITSRNKIESYLRAGELYAKAGRIDDADEMFTRAARDADKPQREKIKLTQKNIYFAFAKDLESKGKRVTAMKFYERLIKMDLEDFEKKEIKEKLIYTYNSRGLFRDAKLVEGL